MSSSAAERPGFWQDWAERWNAFWFTPTSPLPLCVMRIGVGICLALYLLLLTPDLAVWMGANGIFSDDLFRSLVLGESDVNRFTYWSVFNFCSPSQMMAVHYAAIVIAILFAAGVFTRVTSVLALLALLQYVHRVPLITTQAEPLLAWLLLYLCLGPCGAAFSFDAWRKNAAQRAEALEPHWTGTVSLRLIQVHLSMFYLMMAAAKLQGEVWWKGEGIWALMGLVRSRPFDFSSVRGLGYLLNLWTHIHLLYELSFPGLVWPRMTRPIMLWTGVVLWLLMLLASGLVTFCLLMIVASVAFVPAERLRRR
jgi:hypothetical protein